MSLFPVKMNVPPAPALENPSTASLAAAYTDVALTFVSRANSSSVNENGFSGVAVREYASNEYPCQIIPSTLAYMDMIEQKGA